MKKYSDISDEEVARRKATADQLSAAIARYAASKANPLINALNSVGADIQTIAELRLKHRTYPEAIPVLVRHLKEAHYFIREDIVRNLTAKDAGADAYKALLDEFKCHPRSDDRPEETGDPILNEYLKKFFQPQYEDYRFALGNALSVVAGKDHFDEILELIRDKRHASGRFMLVERLPSLFSRKADRERAIDTLIEALKDADLVVPATKALGQLRAQRARPFIEQAVANSKLSPQDQLHLVDAARKALKKIPATS